MIEEDLDEFCEHFMKEYEWRDDVSDGNICETCGNHSCKFTPEETEYVEMMGDLVKCLLGSKLVKSPIFSRMNGRCNLHTAIIKKG
jgi:hypothetical protein